MIKRRQSEQRQPERQPISLGFVRGIGPDKWVARWQAVRSRRPITLVPINEVGDAPTSTCDMTLVRTWPGIVPERSEGSMRTRHAVRLYDEAIALVVPTGHDAAGTTSMSVEELSLLRLLDHPDHAPQWPAPEPWQDPAWRPASIAGALEIVATGLGAILMPHPLARHLVDKHAHVIIPLDEELAPSTVWATWEVSHDSDEMQELIGVLRGRTARSSR